MSYNDIILDDNDYPYYKIHTHKEFNHWLFLFFVLIYGSIYASIIYYYYK